MKRRVLFFAMLTMLVFTLVACDDGNSNLKINTVSDAKLTEREEVILLSTADKSFVFDFNVDDNYKDVAVWVEKYELGKLVGEVNHISTQIKIRVRLSSQHRIQLKKVIKLFLLLALIVMVVPAQDGVQKRLQRMIKALCGEVIH